MYHFLLTNQVTSQKKTAEKQDQPGTFFFTKDRIPINIVNKMHHFSRDAPKQTPLCNCQQRITLPSVSGSHLALFFCIAP
jgi:hypothetical protein